MKKLNLEQWRNVFNNLDDYEDVEVLWLDGTDEWVLCYDTDLFEDGFNTEREAMDRIEMIEELI